MKTRNEILKDKYTIDDFVFSNDTPKNLAEKLIQLVRERKRIILDYGDTKTKKSWGEVYDITGYVSNCKGNYGLKWIILVHNNRSMGGGTILTNRILSIKESKGKKIIYSIN